ncbi:MAG: hypothetical protein ABII03_04060 [Nanoarchaeota archaeon]
MELDHFISTITIADKTKTTITHAGITENNPMKKLRRISIKPFRMLNPYLDCERYYLLLVCLNRMKI